MAKDRYIYDRELEVIRYDEGNGDETIVIPIPKMISRLQAVLEKVPPHLRDTAVLKFWASGDYASGYVEAHYSEPETDEQYESRMLSEARQEEKQRADQEKRERSELARLKAKFGEN